MKKFWLVFNPEAGSGTKRYDSYEAAEEAAKQGLANQKSVSEIVILEAVALVKRPVPEAVVFKIT